MKKLICIVLVALLLTACGANPATGGEDPNRYAQILSEEVTFTPWEQDGLPTEGSYYLTKDVELAACHTVTGDLKLHLNGYNIVAANDTVINNLFVVPAGARMTVYDEPLADDPFAAFDYEEEDEQVFEISTGAIISNRSFSGKVTVSSMFMVAGELVIAGGHIDASDIALEDRANGLAVYVQDGGKVEMTGGVITGGTTWRFAEEEASDEQTAEPLGCGGAVYVAEGGTCTVSGGTIYHGSACEGGNIYVAEGGTLNMDGGRLLDGEATRQGGNVCVAGTMNMSAGSLDWGGSYGSGGNIFLSGSLYMTGGTLQGGACDVNARGESYGGNLTVNGIHAKVKISGAQILDGSAACKESHGGNIAIVRYGAEEFEVGEGTYIYGGLGHRGGNVYIGHLRTDIPAENLDYVFTKVEMGGGTTTYRGANLCTHTRNIEKPIVVTFNECTLNTSGGERTLAIGAGALLITEAIITINGGVFNGGEFHIYENATVTANGVELNGCTYGGPGQFIENPQ